MVTDHEADFIMLDREELNKLSPLVLRNTCSRSITPSSELNQRAELLSQRLDVSIKIEKDIGELDRLIVTVPVIVDPEKVLELCLSESPLEPAIAKIIDDRDSRIRAMNIAKQVVFLSKEAIQEHNTKYPLHPS